MLDYIPYAAMAAIFAYLAFRIVSKGGFKAALFGSSITTTIGEIDLVTKGVSRDVLRVHRLADGNVGIERTIKAVFGFSTTTITLTPEQAHELHTLLDFG